MSTLAAMWVVDILDYLVNNILLFLSRYFSAATSVLLVQYCKCFYVFFVISWLGISHYNIIVAVSTVLAPVSQ